MARRDTARHLPSLGLMSSNEARWSEACSEARNRPVDALLDSLHASFGFTVRAAALSGRPAAVAQL